MGGTPRSRTNVPTVLLAGLAALVVAGLVVGHHLRADPSPPAPPPAPAPAARHEAVPDAVAPPVSVCIRGITPEVLAIARRLDAYVVCRPAASDEAGHLEPGGRIVLEARAGITAEGYAETAVRLATRLEAEQVGILA
ncbi:MAG: hypothetical protein AB7V15_05805 [Acidimicrobiia bacterium]